MTYTRILEGLTRLEPDSDTLRWQWGCWEIARHTNSFLKTHYWVVCDTELPPELLEETRRVRIYLHCLDDLRDMLVNLQAKGPASLPVEIKE